LYGNQFELERKKIPSFLRYSGQCSYMENTNENKSINQSALSYTYIVKPREV